MSESRTFRRGNSIMVPLRMNDLFTGVTAVNGIAALFGRHWLWAALNLSTAAAGWLDQRWAARTPIIEIAGGEMAILRHSFRPARRVRIAAITGVDDSRPTIVRLYVQGGKEVRIPLHWLEWDDRAPFLAWVRSLAPTAAR
jgi:hypothetical protein